MINCGKSVYHVYIQGHAENLGKAGKFVLGIKESINQFFLKIVEGKIFGVVKIFVRITQRIDEGGANFMIVPFFETSNFDEQYCIKKSSQLTPVITLKELF